MKLLFSFLAILLVATTGCVSPAKKLDSSLVSQIKEGITTRQEVETLFGPPKETATGANQKTLAYYRFQQAYRNPGWVGAYEGHLGSVGIRTLSVLYDNKGTVEKFLASQYNTVVSRDENGISAGRVISEETFAKIIKGITSKGEVIQWLGPPTTEMLTLEGDQSFRWNFARKGRWAANNQVQEFRVILDDENFVKDFGLIKSPRLLGN